LNQLASGKYFKKIFLPFFYGSSVKSVVIYQAFSEGFSFNTDSYKMLGEIKINS